MSSYELGKLVRSLADVGRSENDDPVTTRLERLITSEAAQELAEALRYGRLDLDRIVDRTRSREVSTHYKWCLIAGPEYSLWLNEYKGNPTLGYATSVHNHRYSFASTVVSGSIAQRQYSIDTKGERIVSLRVESEFATAKGESYVIDGASVHQVTAWADETSTLVLKGPVERRASQSFDFEAFRVREIPSISQMSPLNNSQRRLL